MLQIRAGIDVLLDSSNAGAWGNIGLVTNDAARTAAGIPGRLALQKADFRVATLFSPEHGITVAGEDGAFVADGKDTLTGIPIVSLYGEKMAPSGADLENIDTIFFDIPDAGARFYTYLWTLTYVMQACAQANKPLVVLDRPNPTGLQLSHAEGPMLDEVHCSSFIGRWSIPIRHSCTLGELARYFAATRMPGLQLQVVACRGLSRSWHALLDAESFVPTSPAIRTARAAFLYPGTGLLEGINVSEGRGTSYPFEWFGAPWINSTQLFNALYNMHLPGLHFEPLSLTPTMGEYAGLVCHGLRLHITDTDSCRPVASVLHIIKTLLQLYGGSVAPRSYPTVANPTGAGHLDKLLGVVRAFEQVKIGTGIVTDANLIWKQSIESYLLYD